MPLWPLRFDGPATRIAMCSVRPTIVRPLWSASRTPQPNASCHPLRSASCTPQPNASCTPQPNASCHPLRSASCTRRPSASGNPLPSASRTPATPERLTLLPIQVLLVIMLF